MKAPLYWSLFAIALFASLSQVAGQGNPDAAAKLFAIQGRINDAVARIEVQTSTNRTGGGAGLLLAIGAPSPDTDKLVAEANSIRTAYFKEVFGVDAKKILNWAIKRAADEAQLLPHAENVMLTVYGCERLASKVFPALWEAFAKQRAGYVLVTVEGDQAKEYRIINRRPGQTVVDVVAVKVCENAAAIKALRNGACQIALSSRDAEPGAESLFDTANLRHPSFVTVLGLERLVVVTRRANALENVSFEQLAAVFGGRDNAMTLYVPEEDGGWPLEGIFTRPKKMTAPPNTIKCMGSLDSLLKALNDGGENSLGVLPLPPSLPPDLRVLPVSRSGKIQQATVENVRLENYPLTRHLLMFMTNRRPLIAKQFKDFAFNRCGDIYRQSNENIIPLSGAIATAAADQESSIDSGNEEYDKLVRGWSRAKTPFVIRFDQLAREVDLYHAMNPLALPNLRNLVSNLMEDADSRGKVLLIGHQDDFNEQENGSRRFGTARVINVKDELESLGITVAPLEPNDGNSMGHKMPIAPYKNLTGTELKQARDLNRRVDLWYKPAGADLHGARGKSKSK